MFIDVSQIMKRDGEVANISFQENMSKFSIAGRDIVFLEPVDVKGTLLSDGEIIYFNGQVKVKLKLVCDRCLSGFEKEMVIDVEEKFSDIDNQDTYILVSNKIDFTPIVQNNILINLPMKLVCNEDCKGICTYCGTNLNQGTCNCIKPKGNSEFEKLKNLFK